MFKEFPYYDRCKPIFTTLTVVDSPVQANIAPAVLCIESDTKPEPSGSPSPVSRLDRNPVSNINTKRNIQNTTFTAIKKRKSDVIVVTPNPPDIR